MVRRTPAKPRAKIGQWPAHREAELDIGKLLPYARNARVHSAADVDALANAISEFGWTNRVLVDEQGVLIAGHGRVLAARKLGITKIPVMIAEGWSEQHKNAFRIWDNKSALNAQWDDGLLKMELLSLQAGGFNLALTGFAALELVQYTTNPAGDGAASPTQTLSERFGVVPFSVLNAREGWWQDRKRAWIALGIKSEVGRGENLLKFSDTILDAQDGGTRKATKAAASVGRT